MGSDLAQANLSSIVGHSIHINSWLVLIGIMGFVASFAISVGPVMWVLFSELFPNRVRGLAISFAGFINSAISFTVQLVFPWELQRIGNASTFMIYGAFGLIGLIFVLVYLPETKGKSLEELEKFLAKS
jgi:MFS family permease